MPSLLEWYRSATCEVPEVFRLVEAYIDRDNPVLQRDGYPWNVRWADGARAPTWLRRLLRDVDLAEAWCEGEAVLPAPDESAMLRLSKQFHSAASWVFLIHGNVNDYVFDGHLGYAPLPTVLESYWLDSCLFSVSGVPSEALALRYSLSAGLQGPRSTEGGSQGADVRKRVSQHNDQVGNLAPDQRVFLDLAFLRMLLEDSSLPPTMVFFERVGLLLPSRSDQVMTSHWVEHVLRWAAHVPASPRHMLVLAADAIDALNAELRKRVNGVIQIELGRPARPADRQRFLFACLAACGDSVVELPRTRLRKRSGHLPFDLGDVPAFAEATAGLNFKGIETSLLNIMEENVGSRDEAFQLIKQQRGELLRAESEGLLQLVEPSARFEQIVGGLDAVRDQLRFVIRAMGSDSGKSGRALLPMGVLFVGPPGTGKSLTAEALASECAASGVHFVKMGDFRDMWVGQSERNFTLILKLLETFGKVIVFMDEIDQTEGGSRSQGDRHETSRRIFGKLLEFMANQDHRGGILWIAATNRPGNMDPALLRPGRFDLILPFDPPDEQGCRDILALHLDKCGLEHSLGEADLAQAAGDMASRGFTGAEIQFVVTHAARRAFSAKKGMLSGDDLLSVLTDYRGNPKDTDEYLIMLNESRKFVPFESLRRKNP